MTILVPLTLAAQTTKFDEIVVYNAALSPSQIADHYAGAFVSYSDDPQDALGWEEVYGDDYPLTAADVPVISNGLCRVRYVAATLSFAIDAFTSGIGWQEQGRVTLWYDATGGVWSQTGSLREARVTEWTPERGVVAATVAPTPTSTYRAELYISLQRGWSGPRFEMYPSPSQSGQKIGVRLAFSAYQAASVTGFSPGGGVGTDPWFALVGQSRGLVATWYRATDANTIISDSTAYVGARQTLAVSAAFATAGAGYGSFRLGVTPRGMYRQAEAGNTSASGTVATVADGAAVGGSAVRDTQTAATATTVVYPATAVARYSPGRYQVWVRVRVGTAGDTASVTAAFTGTGGTSATATTTSATYVWLYVGEIVKGVDAAATFALTLWRSAGTGTAGEFVDEIALVPVEMRQVGYETYDGARDLAQENLYDARAVPELVAR